MHLRLQTKACASPIFGNIVLCGHGESLSCALAHGTERDMGGPIQTLSQISICDQEVLAVVLKDAFEHVPLVPVDVEDESLYNFQGISAADFTEDSAFVCVGCSSGHVHIFKASKALTFSKASIIGQDGVDVLALTIKAASSNRLEEPVLFTSTANSAVFKYSNPHSCCKLQQLASLSEHVVALEIADTFLICGQWNGDIQILAQDDLTAVVNVAAHSRFLSGLQVHPSMPLLVSCAQDGTVAIWELKDLQNGRLHLKNSFFLRDTMLTGAQFLNEEILYHGHELGLDSVLMTTYSQPSIMICVPPHPN